MHVPNAYRGFFGKWAARPFWAAASGTFYAYAPERYEYPINRFTMEVKRQLDVLDQNLAEREFICGDDYTIADIAIHPWYGALAMGMLYESGEFLDVGLIQKRAAMDQSRSNATRRTTRSAHQSRLGR